MRTSSLFGSLALLLALSCIDLSPRGQLRQAYSDYFDRCGVASQGFLAEAEPTLMSIVAQEEKDATLKELDIALADHAVAFDAASASRCADFLRATACDAQPTLFPLRASTTTIPACGRALSGEHKDGEECESDVECPLASTCHGLTASSCGTCAAVVAKQDGDCSHADCAPGFECDDEGHCDETGALTPEPVRHAGDACPDFDC